MRKGITDVPGIRVGHHTDLKGLTGCTVILTPDEGAVAGIDVRGSAPGTRETDVLKPMNLVDRAHAVVLCGGSAFGLDAASGVMQYLEEREIGFDTGNAKVPIVAAAVLYDLGVGNSRARPDAPMGYQACLKATTHLPAEGNHGAGTGATVAKYLGIQQAIKGGIGTYSIKLSNDVIVGAISAVNAFGDIIDWQTGTLLAGPRDLKKNTFLKTLDLMRDGVQAGSSFATNTTLSVVATNAKMDKVAASKVAQVSHNGLARAINPVHTMFDGDVVFALSTGMIETDVTSLAAIAAEVVAESIKRAVLAAESAAGIPSVRDFGGK